MIRALLAVACAVALLAASMPAIDDARIERTEQRLATDLDGIDRAASDLADAEAPRTSTPGPQRVVTITVPERHITSAGVKRVVIGGDPPEEYAYRVRGGPERTIGSGVDITSDGEEPIVLSEPGVHRIVLRLESHGGNRTVVASRDRPG